NYEILVRNRSDLFQLKHLLKDYPNVVQKIRIADYDDDIYLNNNKEIEYNLEGNTVTISTNYNGNGSRSGFFEMEVEEGTYKIISGQVLSKTGNTIRFYPSINIEFESEPCLKVTFKDQVTNKEPWNIISYCKKPLNQHNWWDSLTKNWQHRIVENYLLSQQSSTIKTQAFWSDVYLDYFLSIGMGFSNEGEEPSQKVQREIESI